MKIVLLESLGIAEKELDQFAQKLKAEGHEFCAYEKNTDEDVQIERAKMCIRDRGCGRQCFYVSFQ